MFMGVLLSGWYWVLPRDAVNVETQYMQRGGHLMMSEIHNTGSRAITDVVVQVHFESANGCEIYETMRIEVDSIRRSFFDCRRRSRDACRWLHGVG